MKHYRQHSSEITSAHKYLALALLAFLLILFLSSCAANLQGAAGKVNGRVISSEEFYSSYHYNYSIFSRKYGRSPSKDEKQSIVNETWLNFTKVIILNNYFAKYKIKASAREVLDTLSNNIPQDINKSAVFQVNGKFDRALYQQSLLTDRPENLMALRRHYQDTVIPIQKLKVKLIEKELITAKDSKLISKILASDADLKLYIFDAKQLEVKISDSEISSFYQANSARYRLQPYLRLAYGFVPVLPDSLDHLYAKAAADSLWQMLNSGMSLEEINNGQSLQTSLISMVDHGFVKNAELPVEVYALLTTIIDGGFSKPIAAESGWVIYQKLQSTKTLTQYRSFYIQSLPRSTSLVLPETKARSLMKLAMNLGLEEACEEFDLGYAYSEPMHPDSLHLPAYDIKAALLKRLKSAKSGTIMEPLYSTQQSAFIVVEVLENQNHDYQPISEVKDYIIEELIESRKLELNKQRVAEWLSNPSLLPNAKAITLSKVNMDSQVETYPFAKIYYSGVLAYLEKKTAPVIEHQGVLIVPQVYALSQSQRKISLQQIKSAFVQSLPENWFEQWLQQQVSKAKVIKSITP